MSYPGHLPDPWCPVIRSCSLVSERQPARCRLGGTGGHETRRTETNVHPSPVAARGIRTVLSSQPGGARGGIASIALNPEGDQGGRRGNQAEFARPADGLSPGGDAEFPVYGGYLSPHRMDGYEEPFGDLAGWELCAEQWKEAELRGSQLHH